MKHYWTFSNKIIICFQDLYWLPLVYLDIAFRQTFQLISFTWIICQKEQELLLTRFCSSRVLKHFSKINKTHTDLINVSWESFILFQLVVGVCGTVFVRGNSFDVINRMCLPILPFFSNLDVCSSYKFLFSSPIIIQRLFHAYFLFLREHDHLLFGKLFLLQSSIRRLMIAFFF